MGDSIALPLAFSLETLNPRPVPALDACTGNVEIIKRPMFCVCTSGKPNHATGVSGESGKAPSNATLNSYNCHLCHQRRIVPPTIE